MTDMRLAPGDLAPAFTLEDAAGIHVSLSSFRDKEGLTFPLLSDPDRAVLEAYGAYGEKKLYGKTTVGVIRSTFVVDANGRIEKALYGVKATGHVARLRAEVGA